MPVRCLLEIAKLASVHLKLRNVGVFWMSCFEATKLQSTHTIGVCSELVRENEWEHLNRVDQICKSA